MAQRAGSTYILHYFCLILLGFLCKLDPSAKQGTFLDAKASLKTALHEIASGQRQLAQLVDQQK